MPETHEPKPRRVIGTIAGVAHDPTPKHYRYSYRGHKIDPYRIFKIYGITEPGIQHAIKKLLCAGKRVVGKPVNQDIEEAIAALQRQLEINKEDDADAQAAAQG